MTGIDQSHLKCECIQGSIVNGTRETNLYSFALDQPPRRKIYKKPIIKLFKNINKPIPSPIPFYLENADHKAVDFNGKVISFTCQIIKIK